MTLREREYLAEASRDASWYGMKKQAELKFMTKFIQAVAKRLTTKDGLSKAWVEQTGKGPFLRLQYFDWDDTLDEDLDVKFEDSERENDLYVTYEKHGGGRYYRSIDSVNWKKATPQFIAKVIAGEEDAR